MAAYIDLAAYNTPSFTNFTFYLQISFGFSQCFNFIISFYTIAIHAYIKWDFFLYLSSNIILFFNNLEPSGMGLADHTIAFISTNRSILKLDKHGACRPMKEVSLARR